VITAVLPFVAIVETVARPELLIITTLGTEDVHVGVTFTVDPFAFVPVAVNCCVCPACTVGLLGEIVIEIRVVPDTKNFPHPLASRTGKVIAATMRANERNRDSLFRLNEKRLRISLSMRNNNLLGHERTCSHLMHKKLSASFCELPSRGAQLRRSLRKFQRITQVGDQVFGVLDTDG
jgi:hypothetical protein